MIAAGARAAAMMVTAAALAAGCGGSSSSKPYPRDAASDTKADGPPVSSGSGGSSSGTGGSGTGGFVGSGGTTGSGGSQSDGAAGGSQDGAAEVGVDAPASCVVRLFSVSPSSFGEEVEAGPMSRVRLRAEVTHPGPRPPRWTWRVSDPALVAVTTTAVGGEPATVEFPIKTAGNYSVQADVDTGTSCPSAYVVVRAIPPRPASFMVRVTPPETSGLPVQDRQISLMGTGFSPTAIELMAGKAVTVATYDADVVWLPSYVRISSAASRVSIEGYTGRRPVEAMLLEFVTYDLLLIPDGPVAPKLLSDTAVALPRTIMFDPGTTVTGRAVDGRGQPVEGAHVVLRAGARPSTVGHSDAVGAFDLLTRGGTMSAEVSAPDGSGLPNLRVPAAPGIVLQDGAPLDLTVKWTASTTARLQIAVSSTDGTTSVAGALVRVESNAASTEMMGQLTVKTTSASAPTEIVLPASGAVKVEATTNTAGTATFAALATGSYRVTVIPQGQAAGAMAATTTASVDVPAAGLTRTLRLAKKVKLSGTLLPAASTAGVRITAIDDDTRASTTTTAAAGGRYELLLDPGRSYRLWAQPAPSQALGRAGLGAITAGSADGSIPDRTVPRGIVFDGHVTAQITGNPVNGALIQVFCLGSAASCLDPNVSVADAVSDVSGDFHLLLPDPGQN